MPSSPSFATRQSLPHLSQMIKLEPEQEPWCVGYAVSQGRRCHNRTNAHGRRCAMKLLDEATDGLNAGRCIDDLLEELAPHVLCRRWHQSQASDLIARWQKQIRSFMRSQEPPRRESTSRSAGQPMRVSTRTASSDLTRAIPSESSLTNMEDRYSEMYQTLQEVTGELRRLQALQASFPIFSSTIETSNPRARDRGSTSSTRHMTFTNGSAPSTERLQRTTIATQVANTSGSNSAPSTSTRQLLSQANPRTEERAERQNTDSSSRLIVHVTRRTIEGPCGICLEALKSTEPENTDDSNEEYDSDSESDGDFNEENEEESEQEEPRLIYCMTQCGNNFHESCLHEWLEHSIQPTCPMCRCAWKD